MSHENYIQPKDKYYSDYPNEPIGGGNPYYRCCSCGISDPQINGMLKNHAKYCLWAIEKYEEILKNK